MLINELLGAASWLSFASHHADILEKRTALLSKEILELKSQSDIDELLFKKELACERALANGLDVVKNVAEEVDKLAQEALPELKEKVAKYAALQTQIQRLAACAYVPDTIVTALQELHDAIKLYKEARGI